MELEHLLFFGFSATAFPFASVGLGFASAAVSRLWSMTPF